MKALLCLNPFCRAEGRRHYITRCDVLDNSTKTTLLEQYRKAKNAHYHEARKKVGDIWRVAYIPSSQHASFFKAFFAKEPIEVGLLADQDVDANFFLEDLLEELQRKLPNIIYNSINPPQIHRGVRRDSCLSCHKQVKLDVFLQIRDGASIILKNIVRKVAKESTKMPVIGRRVLESPGCVNLDMLMAARNRFGDEIGVKKRLEKDGNEEEHDSTIVALHSESVFHNGDQLKDDYLARNDVYVDLGDDSERKIEKNFSRE